MHKRLKWNAVGLDQKTQILYEKMLIEKQQEPPENLKNLRRLQLFIDELKFLLDIMKKIHNELIPELEKILRVQQDNPLKPEDYKELASSGDAADVLALIGDSVLDLCTVQLLWDSSLATAGELTKRRADLVANENLAKLCEKWNLYDYRMKRLNVPSELNAKVKTIEHEKATLVEAIYGVIYLEFGYDELVRTLSLIQ